MNEIEILKGILTECDLTQWRKDKRFASSRKATSLSP
jgi:hypothetical protein